MLSPTALPPRIGMLATVRNRRGLLTAVQPFDYTAEGRLHLVTVEFTEDDGPVTEQLVWEREPGATLLEPNALPDVAQALPMVPADHDALVRATRWTALSPFVDPDGEGPLARVPVSAPFHGAIQVEDYQLVPLLKALAMPRIALLLADDVGLGKTVEAGLVLSELILRRRIRRVLVICPASLRTQWQQELHDKFALPFALVDRDETHALRRRLGLDANPWRTHARVITSYHYLKQPDVLERFRAACRLGEAGQLPWDLLVVDEAHNLAPAAFGEDSELSRMLGVLTQQFEHKLFLTATPHNGHTRSFTGLLEYLDPVRFSRASELSVAERARVDQVLVRRLKRDINARTNPPRFCARTLQAVDLALGTEERALSEAFQAFRTRVRSLVMSGKRTEQRAGAFAVEILNKRLLSGPVTFADSWRRFADGAKGAEPVDASEVRAAESATSEETGDDRENESRLAHASRTVGAWLQPLAAKLAHEISAIDAALNALGLDDASRAVTEITPRRDARFEALCAWIDTNLRTAGGQWRDDERMVVFTEFKTTLDSLAHRLKVRYRGDGAIRLLFGETDTAKRDAIKIAFNDPDDPVRILLATDAASEGLNLQETARYLLHFDVPWNPSRLEQRNGRLDRHGQARDVVVHHFATDDDADLRFLAHVVRKVDQIREDLGATGEVFDAAFERRCVAGDDAAAVLRDLDAALAGHRVHDDVPRHDGASDTPAETGEDELKRLSALADEIDLDPETLCDTLEVALGLGAERPRFDPPDTKGRVRLRLPVPPAWTSLVDDTLRLPNREGGRGALPALTFDPRSFLHARNGRTVFRPAKDTALMHLGHPMYQRALAMFARLRFPGAGSTATRWTVRHDALPAGVDAVIALTVEELAVNALRETFHHWVRTVLLPVHDGDLGAPLPHATARALRLPNTPVTTADVARARTVWNDVDHDVKGYVRAHTERLGHTLEALLVTEGKRAREDAVVRFQSRQGELSHLIEQQSTERLEREIRERNAAMLQPSLFDNARRDQSLRAEIEELEHEKRRRVVHYEALRAQLNDERARVLDKMLPKRFALHGAVQVFPVAVEIRLPSGASEVGR